MPTNYFKSGSWNAICDVCGLKHKAEELRKRWDGLMVCPSDFEYDHPQKYLRVHETGEAVPWIRDEPADLFKNVCYIWGISAYADLAVADCAQADNVDFTYEFLLSIAGGPGITIENGELYYNNYLLVFDFDTLEYIA